MTNRQTRRGEEERPEVPTKALFSGVKGYDSCSLSTGHESAEAAEIAVAGLRTRSQKRLKEIVNSLNEREREMLFSLQHCRYLITSQIQRLHFADAKTPTAGLRAANRNLVRMKELGLIETLPRRIGGVRAGSASLIWYLTSAGERTIRLNGDSAHLRKRFFEPSPFFLAHTLATAECYVQLKEMCKEDNPRLIKAELETHCWRSYSHKGKLISLRPDLFAVTDYGEFEDRWFFEIDLKSEAPVTVLKKCRRYHEYHRSGLEQKQHEVFPLTVWIVPDAARKVSLTEAIRAEFSRWPKLFIVITPDELEPLIRQGAKRGDLC